MLKRTWCEIDLDAIPHNLAEIRKLAGNTRILGIVKANGYGHGALACTKAMEENGVDLFGAACLQEALELRQGGIQSDILILGYTAPEDLELVAGHDLIQTIVDEAYAHVLNDWAADHGTTLRTHVKIDTGMNRIGLPWKDGKEDFGAIASVYALPNLRVEGLFSHYPVSDDLQESSAAFTRHQTERFRDLVRRLQEAGIDPGLKHIQNSYGILNYGDLGMDYCRPGLLWMGVTSDDAIPIQSNPDFHPVLSWKTIVTMVKEIGPDDTVSYGRHFKAQGKRKIASLAVGYADGLPRAASNKGLEVQIGNTFVPIVGNICMDQCMADVTGLDVQPGDIVTLVGPGAPIDRISRLAGTINNETLTRITSRVPRKEVHHGSGETAVCGR